MAMGLQDGELETFRPLMTDYIQVFCRSFLILGIFGRMNLSSSRIL